MGIVLAGLLSGTGASAAAECSYGANPEAVRIEVTWTQADGETTASFYPAGEIIVTRRGLKPLFGCLTDIENKRFAELTARPGLAAAARCLAKENSPENVQLTGSLLEGAFAEVTLARMPAHLKDLAMWCGAAAKAHFGEILVLAFPEPGPPIANAPLSTLLLTSLVAELAAQPAGGPRGADAVGSEIMARRDVEVIPYLLTQVNSTKKAPDGASVQKRARDLLLRLMGDAVYREVFGDPSSDRYDLNAALSWYQRIHVDLQKEWAARWADENPLPCGGTF